MRSLIRSILIRAGLGDAARRLHTDTLLLGERASFALRGRPQASNALVILAPGRTGSTWLQEVLSDASGTQPIHEPLSPRHVSRVRDLGGRANPEGYISSIYLRPDSEAPEWRALLEDILRGKVRNHWTNPTIRHHFPSGFLVKLIRGNLLAGFLARHFNPKIVVLERHPGAVLASRLTAGWRADVADILSQPHLMEDHLVDQADAISRHLGDPVAALAVWFAVETAICRRQMVGVPHARVRYEDLARAPLATFDELLGDLGFDGSRLDEARLTVASRTGRGNYSLNAEKISTRLAAWRDRLTPDQAALAEEWCDRLGVGDLCEEI